MFAHLKPKNYPNWLHQFPGTKLLVGFVIVPVGLEAGFAAALNMIEDTMNFTWEPVCLPGKEGWVIGYPCERPTEQELEKVEAPDWVFEDSLPLDPTP